MHKHLKHDQDVGLYHLSYTDFLELEISIKKIVKKIHTHIEVFSKFGVHQERAQ